MKSIISQNFNIYEYVQHANSKRYWALIDNIDVYIDIDNKGLVIDGSFKLDSISGKAFAKAVKNYEIKDKS